MLFLSKENGLGAPNSCQLDFMFHFSLYFFICSLENELEAAQNHCDLSILLQCQDAGL